MAGEQPFDVAAFAAAYQELAQAVGRAAPWEPSPVSEMLEGHLARDPAELPIVSMEIDVFDQPNLQRALDRVRAEGGVELVGLFGLRGDWRMGHSLSLAMLTQPELQNDLGPVDYLERPVDVNRTLTCISVGLLLLRVDGKPFAVLIWTGDERRGRPMLSVEVMSPTREASAELLRRLRALMIEHNVFRGKVVSLAPAGTFHKSLEARFIERPRLGRDDVVLPDGVLERIERMTIGFSARSASLRAGGRHLRRGLLLHGPPGAGKTHTVRYLLSRLDDRTAFVLSGAGLAEIGKTVGLARALQPAVVVLEDVDLVAEERTRPHAGTNPVLFELLNQMDGVEEDADIVFILTTNRPDLLEPALASRPGRVDLAVEVPLPAAAERFRLLELYSRGLGVDGVDWAPVVDRTDGSSAAFLRELLRQAALAGASDDGEVPVVDSGTLLSVLADLGNAGQAITLKLLGASGG